VLTFGDNTEAPVARIFRILTAVVVFYTAVAVPSHAERSEEAPRIGAREHPIILAQFGGEISDSKVTEYVAKLGQKLSSLTTESNDPWKFTVLDSPVVNAFAVPGGYVYVTRGLLATANNEAELAGVLGHEIGHVVSGHGEDRIKRENRAGLGVILGAALGGIFGGLDGAGDAIEKGMKMASGYLSKHSQKEEFQADVIGIDLLIKAGYSPFAQADFLDQLAAKEALEAKISGQQYNPNAVDFFASHPATAERVRQAIAKATKASSEQNSERINEAPFLQIIDGMVYGDTSQEGYVRGLTFSHPELKFTFTVPPGFILQNSPREVTALNRAASRITLDGDIAWTGDMDSYISQRWLPALAQYLPVSDIGPIESLKINTLDAATTVATLGTNQGLKTAQFTAVRFDEQTIRILSITDRDDRVLRRQLSNAAKSFRRLSDAEIAQLRPYRVRIHTVGIFDTLKSLAAEMPQTGFQREQFLALNGYKNGAEIRKGDLVKIIK